MREAHNGMMTSLEGTRGHMGVWRWTLTGLIPPPQSVNAHLLCYPVFTIVMDKG